jgi:hypothetical protein
MLEPRVSRSESYHADGDEGLLEEAGLEMQAREGMQTYEPSLSPTFPFQTYGLLDYGGGIGISSDPFHFAAYERMGEEKEEGSDTTAALQCVEIVPAEEIATHQIVDTRLVVNANQPGVPLPIKQKTPAKPKKAAPRPQVTGLKHLGGLGALQWSEDEDRMLRNAIDTYGDTDWAKIAMLVPRRTAQQCLSRWTKALREGEGKGPWTKEEDAYIRGVVCLACSCKLLQRINSHTSLSAGTRIRRGSC